MGVQTVEVTSASSRPVIGATTGPPVSTSGGHHHPTLIASTSIANNPMHTHAHLDAEKAAASSADQFGKNMQRWRNDNIDIAKGA